MTFKLICGLSAAWVVSGQRRAS